MASSLSSIAKAFPPHLPNTITHPPHPRPCQLQRGKGARGWCSKQVAGWRDRPSMPNAVDTGSAFDLPYPVGLGGVLGKPSSELRIGLWASLQMFCFSLTAWPQHPKVLNNVRNKTNKRKATQPIYRANMCSKGNI